MFLFKQQCCFYSIPFSPSFLYSFGQVQQELFWNTEAEDVNICLWAKQQISPLSLIFSIAFDWNATEANDEQPNGRLPIKYHQREESNEAPLTTNLFQTNHN